jgi:thiol:disulfide interchange protein DsbD
VPERGETDLGIFYGYSTAKVAFKVTPEKEAPASADWALSLTWQACRDGQCLPEETKVLTLKLDRGQGEATTDARNLLHGIIGADTPEWADGIRTEASIKGNDISLTCYPGKKASLPTDGVSFFSLDGEVMPTAPQTWEAGADGSYTLHMTRNLNDDCMYPNKQAPDEGTLPALTKLDGVLAVAGQGIVIDVPVASDQVSTENVSVGGNESLLTIAASLFLGGLILNLMPCVFPVLGLKVLSFVRLGGGERRKVLAHACAFVVGVVLSFWVLTGLLIALKAGLTGTNQSVSWAFWMENPYVIYVLMLLMLVLGLSMFGIFEIGVGTTGVGSKLTTKEGYAGSFWSGVLATVVATPCSAPFLGTAIAPALELSSVGMWIVFTCMGLGMASPYIVLGAFPSLVQKLPKPGAWMESFKQGLSFFLFAAAAWLFWVCMGYFSEAGQLFNAMMGLILFCAAWWVYGRWCPIYRLRRTRIIGLIVALIMAAVGVALSLPPSQQSDADPFSEQGKWPEWQTWSPEAVQEALDEGHPVFVDFTARWCLTCQSNKKIAYSADVMNLLASKEVVLLRADKTQPNPAIDAALKSLNRRSVPVNALYVPGEKTPQITSEILTPGYLLDFFKEQLDKGTDQQVK